jgi:Flp pilus assembly protein TadD
VDVCPTVTEVLGSPAPAGLAGRSLVGALAPAGAAPAARRIYSETLYPRLHLGWSDLASLADDRDHYIESPRPEIYDLAADPGEKDDLAAGLPPALRSMRAELARMARPLQPPGNSDPEPMKKLAALGYISASTADLSKKDLPAPRDHIGAVAQLKEGFGALQGGRYAEAVAVFKILLKTEPGMTDVWQMYGEACMKLGREDEALAALLQAAKLSPLNPQVMMALSDYYLEIGNYEEARKHAEAAGDSGSTSPHENLARIALVKGDLETAERESRAALAKYPLRRIPHLMIARARHDRGDYPGAVAELDLAARPSSGDTMPLQNLNYLRGDSLARLGREKEAEAAFLQEIRDFPANASPRAAMALLYASQGREADARKALSDLVADLHTPEAYFAAIKTYGILGDPKAAAALTAEQRRLFPQAKERRSSS